MNDTSSETAPQTDPAASVAVVQGVGGRSMPSNASQPSQTLYSAANQWLKRPEDERFQTLDALYESVKNRRADSREVTASLHDVSAEVWEDGIRVMLEDQPIGSPTNWSFGQVAGEINFRVSELKKLSPKLAVDVINEQIEKTANKEVKLMRVLGEESDRLQAVTSPGYGRIWDAEVVEMVQKIVDLSGGKFFNPKAFDPNGGEPVPSGLYASDRDVFMFMIDGGSVFDEGPRAKFNRGFIVSNSEVGKASLVIQHFNFNIVCGNHYIWGATDVNMKRVIHSSGAPGRFATNAFEELSLFAAQGFDASPVALAQAIKLQDIRPGSHDYETERDKWIKAFAVGYGFSVTEVKEAIATAVREEGQCSTAWDLAQGFTASARQIPHADTRLNLEVRVGGFLNKLK